MGPMQQRIRECLQRELQPSRLDISDDSESHAEHWAMRERQGHTETHLQIYVVSAKFADLSAVNRHRLVYRLIKEELDKNGLHAVNILTKTPQEDTRDK